MEPGGELASPLCALREHCMTSMLTRHEIGGSEWVRTTALGFSVPCTTTIYTTDPNKVVPTEGLEPPTNRI